MNYIMQYQDQEITHDRKNKDGILSNSGQPLHNNSDIVAWYSSYYMANMKKVLFSTREDRPFCIKNLQIEIDMTGRTIYTSKYNNKQEISWSDETCDNLCNSSTTCSVNLRRNLRRACFEQYIKK